MVRKKLQNQRKMKRKIKNVTLSSSIGNNIVVIWP